METATQIHSQEGGRERAMIEAEGLVKTYGKGEKGVRALDGLTFTATRGTIFALLGPNGAGKTTIVRILTTLLKPDDGTMRVNGFDVLSQPARVRESISLTGQFAAVDEILTGRENLIMIAKLRHVKRAGKVADDLLERYGLADAARRRVATYSGGMRRRLDLAMSLIGNPRIIFLDEPTTGLDPRSRLGLWETIERLVSGGTTVLLTTQYLDEADRLADKIAVIDHGRVIASGTSDDLKDRVGGERLEVRLDEDADSDSAVRALEPMSDESPQASNGLVRLTVRRRSGAIVEAVHRLSEAGVGVDDLNLRRPTLDDVFLTLTGHVAEEDGSPEDRSASELDDAAVDRTGGGTDT